jgi:hypothetical protein
MTDKAMAWISQQKALAPDKPFFVYFAPGATHAPHHVPKEWADKYKGKFDQGWDKLREETLTRQKALGVVPADSQLTARHAEIPAWDEMPAALEDADDPVSNLGRRLRKHCRRCSADAAGADPERGEDPGLRRGSPATGPPVGSFAAPHPGAWCHRRCASWEIWSPRHSAAIPARRVAT